MIVLRVAGDGDVALCRQAVRDAARSIGMRRAESALLITAVSELVRNVLLYAGQGSLRLAYVDDNGRKGIEAEATDEGPGISNLELALQDGYSTGQGLGLGLPGSRRLVDEFSIQTAPGRGTRVKILKWCR